MAQPIFFKNPPSSTLAEIAALTKAHLVDPSRADQRIKGLASLDEAGPMHLAFFDNLKYADELVATKAGACLVSPRFESKVPAHVAVLRATQPFRAFVQIAREWHADALRPQLRKSRHLRFWTQNGRQRTVASGQVVDQACQRGLVSFGDHCFVRRGSKSAGHDHAGHLHGCKIDILRRHS